MKKMFLLFSHTLSDEQISDAKKSLDVNEFVYLEKDLQKIWGNVPTDLASLDEFLSPFKSYLEKNSSKGDIALVQGDFGATYKMVNFAKDLGIVCVYATTKRIIEEIKQENNEILKKSIFKHERFREYE